MKYDRDRKLKARDDILDVDEWVGIIENQLVQLPESKQRDMAMVFAKKLKLGPIPDLVDYINS